MSGPVALVGGGEFLPPARDLDAWLLERSGSRTVTVIPTAAAFQRPELAVATAARHFETLGAAVEELMILDRDSALEPSAGERLAGSALIYLTGGDPRHLAAVMLETPAWAGILEARAAGGVLAGSSAGAMVLCDSMLLPGAKASEPGLGLLEGLLVIPHHDRWSDGLGGVFEATAGTGTRLLGIDESTGLVLEEGQCRILGAAAVTVYRDGEVVWTQAAPALRQGWP